MKKVLLALAAIPAVTMAVEASAQTYVSGNANITLQNQVAQLETQLNQGIQTRSIDAAEARNLRQQIRQLNRLQRQYSANGLSQQEWNVLQQRVGTINQQMQVAVGYAYGNGYNNGYAYGNTGVTYDQYGRQVVVTPGYAVDQYGRPVQVNNGYFGQGGPYVPVPQARSNGIGGIIGNVLGGGLGGGGIGGNLLGGILGNGGLRVGDLVTGVLGNVLGNVSNNNYQSSGNTYFRTDGQRVYEIDARTNQVVRIHNAR